MDLIGAPGSEDEGAAYLYARFDDAWIVQDKLLAADGNPHNFGVGVALEGSSAAVGGEGSVWVFDLVGDPIPAIDGRGILLLTLTMLGAGSYLVHRRAT